jgi:hypothetical protein
MDTYIESETALERVRQLNDEVSTPERKCIGEPE